MIEITDVAVAVPLSATVASAAIERPAPGELVEGTRIEVCGSVIAGGKRIVAVELVRDGGIVVARGDALRFRLAAPVIGMAPLALDVEAVAADRSRARIATVRAVRRWQASTSAVGAPLVSVIIPCFDTSRFLADAIESVLGQTYQHFELIVVDDGSHDNTAAVVQRYPGVTCIRQPNRGLSAARNAGLRRSRGASVVFLDADDRLTPDAIRIGLDELAANPDAAFVSGLCRQIGFDGQVLNDDVSAAVSGDHFEALLRNCYIWAPAAVMFRGVALSSPASFDETLGESADLDLYLRLAARGHVRSHGRIVAEYRRHGSNMTRRPRANLRDRVIVLRRQRPIVKNDPGRSAAYRAGLSFVRQYFGDRLVSEVVSDLATRQYRRALRGFLSLVHYYPRGALSALRWAAKLPLASSRASFPHDA